MAKMMPFVVASGLLVLLTFSAALDPTLDTAWEDWKGLHGKEYLEGEEAPRRAIWEDNWKMIEKHNWEASQGKHTFQLGMNHFGDLTNEEFYQKMDSPLPRKAEPVTRNVPEFHGEPPKDIICIYWNNGSQTPVRDQGSCGCGWAFAAAGAVEALCYNKTDTLDSLSAQQLVDCTWDQGNRGCRYGWPQWAFEWKDRENGLIKEEEYPYVGEDTEKCGGIDNPMCTWKDYVNVTGGEAALQQAILDGHALAAVIDSRPLGLRFYQSGLFSGTWGGKVHNHGVLVVGFCYNITNRTNDFWVVKNSWSQHWGEEGYLNLKMRHNELGIADHASYPV